jgi:hypothetical protein
MSACREITLWALLLGYSGSMQYQLLVTVRGPQHALDVELPGDVPIVNLLPLLHDLCEVPLPHSGLGKTAPASSLVAERIGKPLVASRTLEENGILDGDILLLYVGNIQPFPVRSEQKMVKEIQPSELTGGIGVTWKKKWLP